MFLHSSSIKQTFTLEYQVPDTPGLVWYHFVLALEGNTLYYGNNFEDLGGEGLLTGSNPHSYQITIYRKSTLPLWYKEGIMYQIYVDRFYNGHEDGAILHPKKKSLLHGDWNDIPMYHRAPDRSIDQWDFFGGNLEGVVKKLPYLEDLGVTILYLNPIFEAASNHKYDTGDYLRIDPMYGDEEGFKTLVAEGEKRGIRIILDGVFSHTGADSIYFNKYGHYGKGGAYQSSESPYSSWYSFKENREEYESWWGVKDLPEVKKMEPSFQSFIYGAPDSVIAKWMDLGVSGWRLDVVDELPGAFVKGLSKRVKEKNPEAVLLGEVWEDASRKVSYGVLRDYFAGDELDGAMNYPLRNLLLDFMLARIPSSMAIHRLYSLYENYPKENFQGAMNILGSHDRERILTLLGDAPSEGSLSEWDKAHFKLSPEAYQRAIGRLKLLALIQMTLPGVPCIYYGDEAGMEGYGDPYNRGTYPWERMNPELLAWYKRLTTIRREYDLWNKGDFEPLTMEDNVFAFRIKKGRETLLVYANRSVDREALVHLNVDYNTCQVFDLLSGGQSKGDYRKLEALEGLILLIQEKVIKDPEEKKAGILLPISALPSPWKIGDLGKPARDFLDFLETSEQRLWQMLPINPLGPGNTPYQSNSVFAGSCMYLSMEQLVEEGILWESEIKIGLKELSASKIEEDRVDYEGNQKVKISLLKKAYRNFRRKVFLGKKRTGYLSRDNYEEFLKKNHEWLESYCLYKVLKKKEYGPLWLEWRRNKEAFVHKLNSRQQSAMDYHRFLQYTFFWQWQEMKAYAATKGIELLGDIPIYVAEDSRAPGRFRPPRSPSPKARRPE